MLNFSYSQIKNSRNPLTHADEDVELSKDFFDRSKELLEDAKTCMLVAISSMMNPL